MPKKLPRPIQRLLDFTSKPDDSPEETPADSKPTDDQAQQPDPTGNGGSFVSRLGRRSNALHRLGVPENGGVIEPGCGCGRFIGLQPSYRWIGVELDSISGRIARLLHPQADIRIQNFRDTRLPQLDAVIGNVPFADVKLEHNGNRFSLHDYFFAKSLDALNPGGVLALVTSHFTLDEQNAVIREYLAERADFLGAIRLPQRKPRFPEHYLVFTTCGAADREGMTMDQALSVADLLAALEPFDGQIFG